MRSEKWFTNQFHEHLSYESQTRLTCGAYFMNPKLRWTWTEFLVIFCLSNSSKIEWGISSENCLPKLQTHTRGPRKINWRQKMTYQSYRHVTQEVVEPIYVLLERFNLDSEPECFTRSIDFFSKPYINLNWNNFPFLANCSDAQSSMWMVRHLLGCSVVLYQRHEAAIDNAVNII